MSSTKHTQGPWFAVEYAGTFIIKDEDYYDAGNQLLDREQCDKAEANAVLAAAAPALLNAVKMAYDILRELPNDDKHDPGQSPLEILKAAIKRATQ